MNIWMINQYALPATEVGHTRHFYLAKALAKRGHNVTVISSNFNHFSGKYVDGVNPKAAEIKNHDGVKFLWLPVPTYKGNSLGRIKNMLSFAKRLTEGRHFKSLERPDVVIGSSPQPFAAFGSYLLSKRQHAPFVLEIRDLWPESLIDLGKMSTRHPMVWLVRKLINRLYKKSSKIISLLPNSMDYLASLGVPHDKIVWAPNFVNIEAVPEMSEIIDQPFTIMYAGSHGLANGLNTVVQTAKKLVDLGHKDKARFVLIGHGAEKKQLMQFAADNDLSNIEFRDVVPKSEIFDVLKTADAFLMLLQDSSVFQYGISPNKLFDYLALGKPVISNIKAKFHPDDLDAAVIHIPPGDTDAFADAVISLINMSQQDRDALGEKGRKLVYDYFTADQVAKIIEAALL